MKVSSSAIKNGVFEDKYGKRGIQFGEQGMPTYSIPLEITDAPEGTKSFAIVLEDKDAITAAGFVWIHWLVANLHRTTLEENESQTADDFIQGKNSWSAKFHNVSVEDSSCYGGMAPPNCLHRYELFVYALDCDLDLKPGFGYNDLHFAMRRHVLASTEICGAYDV